MDHLSAATLRIRRFLETEPVIWLSSTRSDGGPHLVPTWFAWDGDAIVIRSKAHARKVRNLLHDPRAMVALGDAMDDFDVGLLEAKASVSIPDAGVPPLPSGYLAKYRDRIAELGLTGDEFAATYPATIRLAPARALGWHGRTTPSSWTEALRRLGQTLTARAASAA